MLKSLEKKHIYFAGLLLVAIGLTLSPALMSIGQAVLVLNWLFDSEAGPRYSALWRNKTVVYFLLIFLVHVLGLAYTQNFEYAMKDLKIKLPLLLLPAVIGTSRVLEKRELYFVYYAVLASVFVSSLISFSLYLQMTVGSEDTLRNISPIISHIRLSLIACIAFFISLYFAWEYYTKNKLWFVGMLMYALWMLYFISILGARAGYLSILVASAFILFYKCIEYKKYAYIFVALGIFVLGSWLAYQYSEPIQKRVDEIFVEVESHQEGENPSGKSISQRFVYWSIAREIFSENWLIGVGTGDIDDAFKEYYASHETNLEKQYQHRAHNQYLTILCTFGLLGFLIFMFALVYPYWKRKLYFDIMSTAFLIVLMISMLTEDTLETQAGATFAAFFYSLFILRKGIADIQRVSY